MYYEVEIFNMDGFRWPPVPLRQLPTPRFREENLRHHAAGPVPEDRDQRPVYARDGQHLPTCICSSCLKRYHLPSSDRYRDGFRLLKVLGSGSFGATGLLEVMHDERSHGGRSAVAGWSRYHARRGDKVVAKRMLINDAKGRAYYEKEKRALLAVGGQANVITLFGSYEEPNGIWGHLFIDYCELGTAHDLFTEYSSRR